ncbi:MAG: PH domain-containing protein [Clostridium sp.]|nr:PH domain-containing protein [Clostridium sp.]
MLIKIHTKGTFIYLVSALLLQNEQVINIFQGMSDGVVFTNMRIISANV